MNIALWIAIIYAALIIVLLFLLWRKVEGEWDE